MTKKEWFTEADGSKDKVKSLIDKYHPVNRLPGGTDLPITAHNAENACVQARVAVRKNFEGVPSVEYQNALDAMDYKKASNILNDTWFGVPESTLCWNLIGFREMVALLDDPPEDDTEYENYVKDFPKSDPRD